MSDHGAGEVERARMFPPGTVLALVWALICLAAGVAGWYFSQSSTQAVAAVEPGKPCPARVDSFNLVGHATPQILNHYEASCRIPELEALAKVNPYQRGGAQANWLLYRDVVINRFYESTWEGGLAFSTGPWRGSFELIPLPPEDARGTYGQLQVGDVVDLICFSNNPYFRLSENRCRLVLSIGGGE